MTSYAMIFFERVTNKNKAKYTKISKQVRYFKEIEEDEQTM